MPDRNYDVQLRATVTVGGVFRAPDAQAAYANALLELRAQGELSDVEVERLVFLDDEEVTDNVSTGEPEPFAPTTEET